MIKIAVTTGHRDELIDITSLIQAALPAGLRNGVAYLFCRHTTAGLTVNENADPDVKHDILAKLDELIPHRESFYLHGEGNSAAHVKSSLVGVSLAVPVTENRLSLGTWQGIYFCEFDGPREREVELTVINAEQMSNEQ